MPRLCLAKNASWLKMYPSGLKCILLVKNASFVRVSLPSCGEDPEEPWDCSVPVLAASHRPQTHPSLPKKIPELKTSPRSAWSTETFRHRAGQMGTAPGWEEAAAWSGTNLLLTSCLPVRRQPRCFPRPPLAGLEHGLSRWALAPVCSHAPSGEGEAGAGPRGSAVPAPLARGAGLDAVFGAVHGWEVAWEGGVERAPLQSFRKNEHSYSLV